MNGSSKESEVKFGAYDDEEDEEYSESHNHIPLELKPKFKE